MRIDERVANNSTLNHLPCQDFSPRIFSAALHGKHAELLNNYNQGPNQTIPRAFRSMHSLLETGCFQCRSVYWCQFLQKIGNGNNRFALLCAVLQQHTNGNGFRSRSVASSLRSIYRNLSGFDSADVIIILGIDFYDRRNAARLREYRLLRRRIGSQRNGNGSITVYYLPQTQRSGEVLLSLLTA